MFETLITHHKCPLYFGTQMAEDAGIDEDIFQARWHAAERDRSVGKVTLEQVLQMILEENHCYSEKLLKEIAEKRIMTKKECFRHLHPQIIPMLSKLKERGFLIGLISNCFSEEAKVIRESELFPYFNEVCLSYEQGIEKPDEKIFYRCLAGLGVKPYECLYVGDGGSEELETAQRLGMTAVQAVWYLTEGTMQPVGRKHEFEQVENPLEVFRYLPRFEFRSIRQNEAEQAVAIEQICFPPYEACSEKHMKERIAKAPELFLVAVDKETGKLAGFLNGLSTNEHTFRDEFFTDADLYDPEGKNVMLLGLDVLPQYRRQGLGSQLVYEYKRRERENNRSRLILTCLNEKVKMYEKMGFIDNGIADSSWGGEEWHEMYCAIR